MFDNGFFSPRHCDGGGCFAYERHRLWIVIVVVYRTNGSTNRDSGRRQRALPFPDDLEPVGLGPGWNNRRPSSPSSGVRDRRPGHSAAVRASYQTCLAPSADTKATGTAAATADRPSTSPQVRRSRGKRRPSSQAPFRHLRKTIVLFFYGLN